MSGHSKWANIKHKKAAKDAKRGKTFTRIGKELTIAAREGGGDVDANPRLRLAVQNAKAVNMPNDNIKRAIQKGTGEIEGVHYEEITYEGFGPCGGAVMIEVITDNKNRTLSELRVLINKLGGNLGEVNSVAWNFDRKGVITVKTAGRSEDDLLELVLESGADDLEYDTDASRIISAIETLSTSSKFFESKKVEITDRKLEYLAKNSVAIKNVNDAKRVIKFLDSLEEHEDIQNLFSNYDIDDAALEQAEKE
ncbi:MAG: YebC/PmpR family DNA-binding transcriptional regulator [Ignavibacteriae bacterium]|nr:YebC/PmpR family DNA-binding transcriptional regulator [Ignavibacteriota bacterium]